jgi:hypothetical protein
LSTDHYHCAVETFEHALIEVCFAVAYHSFCMFTVGCSTDMRSRCSVAAMCLLESLCICNRLPPPPFSLLMNVSFCCTDTKIVLPALSTPTCSTK